MAKRVQEEFEGYRRAVMPTSASAIQVQECRRAFYAGAHALFQHIMRNFETGEEPTDADLRMMDEIDAELKAFALSVKRGLN